VGVPESDDDDDEDDFIDATVADSKLISGTIV
jgi:hypothetical protein